MPVVSATESVGQVLRRSGLTKSALCRRAGVSRALLDDYLSGAKKPSLTQIERLADAAGLRVHVSLSEKPRSVSREFVAVMELADELAGKRETLPELHFPYDVWRRAS